MGSLGGLFTTHKNKKKIIAIMLSRKKYTAHHRIKAFRNISHFNATKMGSPATKKMRLGHSSGRPSPIGFCLVKPVKKKKLLLVK